MKNIITLWLEKRLKLKVNEHKFLDYSISASKGRARDLIAPEGEIPSEGNDGTLSGTGHRRTQVISDGMAELLQPE
ncbi:hypothetical protein GM30_14915 [Trabulsiella odontotermitis]|nr:hypothetical protein [Trabulsiella odontotermitis]KNC92832.1 hypothetical protein GM30_14915 [Trabulsiella odontotermitis]